MGVLRWGCLVTPKFSVPPSGETMRHTPKSFRGARTCSRSSVTMPSLAGLGYHPPPGWPKTLSFFVCLFVTGSITQRPILRFFAPPGRHVAPMGWNLAWRRGPSYMFWHGGGVPPPYQISPQSVQRQGCRTPKIEIFTQIWPKCGI